MKTLRLLLFLSATQLFGAAFYSDTFTSINSTFWTSVGPNPPQASAGGLIGYTNNSYYTGEGNALLYKWGVPNAYEVKSTIQSYSHPGVYYQYFGVNSPSGSPFPAQWSYYRVAIWTYANYPTAGSCWANIDLSRFDAGSQTEIGSGSAACPDGTTIRTLLAGGIPAPLMVFVNDQLLFQGSDAAPMAGTTGYPVAISGTTGTLTSRVDLNYWDYTPPYDVNSANIGTTPFANRIDMQWQAASDDASGVGVLGYALYKNGSPISSLQTALTYSDLAVMPGTTYTYTIKTIDKHMNVSAGTSFNVTTPTNHINHTIATPPSRIGVRPTGAYWGAGGEQMDMMSGNLNWSLPLMKAQGWAGTGYGFGLNYNSQIWRLDSGGTWNLGYDIGFGFGWRLLAGSITPYWLDQYTVDHYVFTDSTGAEYSLNVNTGGVWTSIEGIHISYDPSTQKLSFPDGTFWMMTCESGGTEPDLGTRYPKVMQDSNGNQLS